MYGNLGTPLRESRVIARNGVELLAGGRLSIYEMSGDDRDSGGKLSNRFDSVLRYRSKRDLVMDITPGMNANNDTDGESESEKVKAQDTNTNADADADAGVITGTDVTPTVARESTSDDNNAHCFDQPRLRRLRSDGGDPSIRPPADREEPVGEPVVRSDPAITGQRAREAVEFDPTDPASIESAAQTVRAFSENTVGADDNVYILRGAAACAALVRGVGSYKQAVERAGGDVSISFVRKWARVHDLPQAIRRHVAQGDIAPTAAKHIARVSGLDRLDLAWAVIDADLTVREVRRIASEVDDETTAAKALAERGITVGSIEVSLPIPLYRELRRRASVENCPPGQIVSNALEDAFETE
jgi:hypothetical protein